ncbi:MAG: LacI family DNA-binding transcriptional regulator [Planctomycetota bacterium]
MATLKQIAELAGVSHATVSNVLNGQSKTVRAAAAKRAELIRRIANDLNYRPDQSARSLRRGRTGMVAVLGTKLWKPDVYNMELFEAMSLVAGKLEDKGFSLSAEMQATEGKSLYRMPRWKVDAAVVVAAYREDELAAVEEAGVPYVSFNGEVGAHGSAVQFDDVHGMNLAVDALADRGHRRIAYVSDVIDNGHRSVRIRRETYLDAMRRRGLTPLPGYQPQYFDAERFTEDFRVFREAQRPTAVVTYNPACAMLVYQAAMALNFRLPDDLSVITFNDSLIGTAALSPRLSAVARPPAAAAEAVTELLLERLGDEPVEPRRIQLQPQLVLRDSVAPSHPSTTD